MKIVVINGTPVKGVTYMMKEEFLNHLRKDNEVTEFYPNDYPEFCLGCKNCFLQGEEKCPHFQKKWAVWRAMIEADILVFAYPVYALHVPASIKSLLDHLCVHWLVHRPEPKFFQKRAVIITNSVGAPNGSAQKDVKTALNWMGLSQIDTYAMPLMGDIFTDKMSAAHKSAIEKKMRKAAEKVCKAKPSKRMNIKVRMLFSMAKLQHKAVLKSEETPGLDNAYYLKHGWIKAPDHKKN